MSDSLQQEWFWEPPADDPNVDWFGPALPAAAIDAWERSHSVRLPGILRRAYGQQDGGRVRGQHRGDALFPLSEVRFEEERIVALMREANPAHFVAGRVLTIGYNDCGASLLLHYVADADTSSEPRLYFYYGDGDTIENERDHFTAADLLQPVRL